MAIDGEGHGPGGLWRHQGLNFEAPFALGEPLPGGSPVDVLVQVGEAKPVGTDVPGPVVAKFGIPAQTFYTVYATDEGYLVRFHRECEFFVNANGRQVVCEPAPECDRGIIGVLMAGTITAFLLSLRGYAVLHGSAVSWAGKTVLFAGYSGMGKTTLAALCCAAGARLVTDDVVPLTRTDAGFMCVGLSRELRLRDAAREIADLFPLPGPPRRVTADGRLAIRPQAAESESNLVSGVVVPRPSREAQDVSVDAVAPPMAVLHLLANSRIPGMVPLDLQKPYFEVVTELVGRVPVVAATVPWGPPFTTAFVPVLLDQLTLGGEG